MKRCALQVGRLVSHPCGAKTRGVCPACHRPMCERHLDGSTKRCLQCAGAYAPSPAPIAVSGEELFAFSDAELAAFEGSPMASQQQKLAHHHDS